MSFWPEIKFAQSFKTWGTIENGRVPRPYLQSALVEHVMEDAAFFDVPDAVAWMAASESMQLDVRIGVNFDDDGDEHRIANTDVVPSWLSGAIKFT